MSRCIGCGSKIQSHNPNHIGYVSEIALIEKGENVYCQRCYGIRHHNLKYLPENNLQDYYAKIKVIKEENALAVSIIDVMDITGGFIQNLKEYIGNNKVLVIVNKTDILPKKMKLNFIENYIRKVAKEQEISVEQIFLGSVKNTNFVEKIINKISKLKYSNKQYNRFKKEAKFDNCYVVGYASVGKSTFMNNVGRLYLNYDKDAITTSNQFQTTIDFIKMPLDKKSYIIDTPGIINPNHFGAYLNYESINLLMPKKYIKPRTYQLNPDQTIFMGGLVRIDFSGNSKINASFYVANELYLHRTKTIQATNIKTNQLLKLLVPPFTEDEYEKIKDEKIVKYHITKPVDIFISGIGFIHLVAEDAFVKFELFKMINIKMLYEEDNE